ncbi:MAG: response regulator transcription factor [Spirochaetaceae bacterium]|jgi:two-component system phosphate regulon response regulator PhoB|nr:response regulator transcription factor [Spirochaetaceae bacterium]
MGKAVILIIEDDPDIRELLTLAFATEGWKLRMAKTGEEGLALLGRELPDCVILDIMLPGMDGLGVLKKIKAGAGQALPVIMTTAKGEEADIVAGLELGADDYVVKPYSPKVLIARIRAALRRKEEPPAGERQTRWQRGPLSLDAERHEALRGGSPLDLSATEFSLLKHFLANPGRVFSRDQIIAAIHGSGYPVTDRSVDVQILGLRKKLGSAGDLIETIRGVGYRFRSPPEEPR